MVTDIQIHVHQFKIRAVKKRDKFGAIVIDTTRISLKDFQESSMITVTMQANR